MHLGGVQVVQLGDSFVQRKERMVLLRRSDSNGGTLATIDRGISGDIRKMPIEVERENYGDSR